MARLGTILLERGLISESQLGTALALQQRHGDRLGDILVAEGVIGYYELYAAIAEHHHLPFIDLLTHRIDTSLLNQPDLEAYLRLRIIPYRQKNGETWFAVCEPSDAVLSWIWQRCGRHYKLAITSPLDIRRTVELHFGSGMEQDSRLGLWHRTPHASARYTLPARQKEFFYALLYGVLALIILMPVSAALGCIIACQLAYSITMLFKATCFIAGARRIREPADYWPNALATLHEQSLPVYTILIPLYRESESLPRMVAAMQRLDYPASRLDIKLVVEADDAETLSAIHALNPRHQFEVIHVPPGTPRTKPKACNYALRFARGEFVTIFDADDQPEPQQLKKAVYAFRTLPENVVCLQARLNYYNADDTLLTRLFSLEYAILFHFTLYGLERFGIPIPLGGTSNHIARARLLALGEWDPYNVTEDADLGTRLAARGYATRMLDSCTMEEAPNRVAPWLRQRSRWIKGYMQTWLVHMRRPLQLYRTLGWRGFIGFHFFVGGSSFTFLTAPLMWVLACLWITKLAHLHQVPFPLWLCLLTGFNLLANLLTGWATALFCARHYTENRFSMVLAALLYPYYTILHALASYRALWQLIVKPHFWEKTIHGLTRHADRQISEHDILSIRGNALTASL